jgi:molecular chaperone Hsp33
MSAPENAPSHGLPDSRLYTFLDEQREFALYFLEGQRLIHDVVLTHAIQGPGFAYFRDAVLSVQPMISLIKRDEQIGFYIDSEDPYFRLKIETGHDGDVRCVLIPEQFREFPAAMHGFVRVLKLFPFDRPPYESVIRADGLALRDIVNRVLRDSYQVHCATMVSEVSDQSAMLHQLPPLPGRDDYDFSIDAVRARRDRIGDDVQEVFARGLLEAAEIREAFAAIGWRCISDRTIQLRCSCSRARMVDNVRLVYAREGDTLFDPGQNALEIVCEYCKSKYLIAREELHGGSADPH